MRVTCAMVSGQRARFADASAGAYWLRLQWCQYAVDKEQLVELVSGHHRHKWCCFKVRRRLRPGRYADGPIAGEGDPPTGFVFRFVGEMKAGPTTVP